MCAGKISPFTLSILQPGVDRLLSKLRDTRHPTQDVAQRHINSFPQYTTIIKDLNIYFVHQRSSDPDAIPLLLIHGWPSTFYEFSDIIPLLVACNGSGPAFHCIAPSLPGFCFSSAPQRRGWTMKDTARVFHALMLRLGYRKYCVQAGDWGQFVARELGAQYVDACRVIHLNYCPGSLPGELSDSDLTERELKCREKGIDWRTNHVGYAVLMRTRPHTVGWMLADNPVGLLAFVGEKYEEAANPAVQTSAKWKDHILTTACLYFFSGCIMSSTLPYFENIRHDQFAEYVMREENLIKCPLGYTSCLFDTAPNSKRAVERTGNLVFYKERDETGHFACLENPEGVAEDVREVVGKSWSRSTL